MNLTLPVPGTTSGPEYAQQNNAAFEAIDAHDHTSSKGVQVPTAGLNINANLPFNGYSPTGLESAVFGDVVGTPVNRSVYVSSGELFYKDSSGNAVQITTGGQIAGTPGSISNLATYESPPLTDRFPSATFSDLARDFTFFYDTGLPAAMNMGDLRLYPYDGAFTSYTNFITLKSPAALGTNYSLTLPTALPANTNFVQVSSSGTLSFTNTITQPVLGAGGSASAPTYSFSGDTNTGMYNSSSDNLTFTTGGTARLTVSTSLTSTVPFYAATGSVSAPTLTFSADTNTGFWLQTTDTIGVTAGGTQRLSIGSSISTNNTAFSTGTGAITGGSLNLSSGGAFKVKLISLGTSAAAVLTAAHGLTATNIIGVVPSIRNGSDGYSTASTATTGNRIDAEWDSTNVIVRRAGAGASSVFYALIFYV